MLQVIVNGLAVGLGIATLAMGFLLVYRPTGVFHIAAGGLYAAAPFLYLTFRGAGAPSWLAAASTIVALVGSSCALEVLHHRSRQRSRLSSNAHLLTSLGVYISIVQLLVMIWGPNPQSLRTNQDQAFAVGSIVVSPAQLMSLTLETLALLTFGLAIRHTGIGLQLRALMQNPQELGLFGYSVPKLRLVTFAVSGALVAVVSLSTAYDLGFDPRGGLSAIVLAITAVVVGGRDSFAGPVVGGILIGILRSFAIWFSPQWQDSLTFAALALSLLFLPNGITGHLRRSGRVL